MMAGSCVAFSMPRKVDECEMKEVTVYEEKSAPEALSSSQTQQTPNTARLHHTAAELESVRTHGNNAPISQIKLRLISLLITILCVSLALIAIYSLCYARGTLGSKECNQLVLGFSLSGLLVFSFVQVSLCIL